MSTPIFIPAQDSTITPEIQAALDAKLDISSRDSWHPMPSPIGVGLRVCPWWLFGGSTSLVNFASPRIDYVPFILNDDMPVTGIGIHCMTAASGAVAYAGIYSDSNGRPGALIHGSAAYDFSVIGLKESVVSGINLSKKTMYWFALCATGGAAKTINLSIGVRVIQALPVGNITNSTNYPIVGYTQNASSLPSIATASSVTSSYCIYGHIF